MANDPGITSTIQTSFPDYLGTWLPRQEPAKALALPQGVALLVHGLNLYSPRMDALGEWLLSQHFEVLRVSLSGHGPTVAPSLDTGQIEQDRRKAFASTSATTWLSELDQVSAVARERADQLRVPLVYVGFSLGGLVGTVFQLRSAPSHRFDRMVLLAPAIVMTSWTHLLRPLKPFPKLGIPAFTPGQYKANRATPIQAYHAMFALYDEFHRSDLHEWSTPTLVLSDVHDEMVPFQRLTKFIEDHKLNWTLYPLHQKLGGKRRHYHLMIDPESVGETIWRRMMAQIHSFLQNPFFTNS